jgi:hypothetical protein
VNGTIAQSVALTCYGNATIRGLQVPPFFPNNSTCEFCDSIKFIEHSPSGTGATEAVLVAGNPDEWLARLIKQRAAGIRLTRTARNDPDFPDRMSAAFVGGGGTWNIEVILNNGTSEIWIAEWEVWNQTAPDRKIWRVTYHLAGTARTANPRVRELEDVKADFELALTDIHMFSKQQNCGTFTERFADALKALDEPQADIGYHKDLAPAGTLPVIAASILKAAMSAWVFGGMGSWNDMGFEGEDQTEYDRTSEKLFLIINEAIEAAASSSRWDAHFLNGVSYGI